MTLENRAMFKHFQVLLFIYFFADGYYGYFFEMWKYSKSVLNQSLFMWVFTALSNAFFYAENQHYLLWESFPDFC